MIDTVYKTLLTIINKENQGYVSPSEFNLMANKVQMEIFREYFPDQNRDRLKDNRGMITKGYSNLPFNQRQRISQFAAVSNITGSSGVYTLPNNLYFIENEGVTTNMTEINPPRVVTEIERGSLGYLNASEVAPSEVYPAYERLSDNIIVYPVTITDITLRYLKTPSFPNWTYVVVNDVELYDPSNTSFQDFELHESEFSNIVVRMLSYFGINIREAEVVQIAETLKDKSNINENN